MIRQRFAGEVSVRIHYLNHDFAQALGVGRYQELCGLGEHQASGIGDWLFRSVAFPGLPDNAEEFLLKYYPTPTQQWRRFRQFVVALRDRLPGLLSDLADRYELGAADLVGFTSMFQQNVASIAMAAEVKRRNPAAVVVLGGANAEAPMGQELLRGVPQLDYVCSGPALRSFPDLVNALRRSDEAATDRIHGVFSRRNVDDVAEPGRADGSIRPLGAELDINAELPLDYDGFMAGISERFPDGRIKPVLLFETSRGCWWGQAAHCTFCGLNGATMAYRRMRADAAISAMQSLFERYGDRCEQFMSVDNIMPREFLTEVLPFLRPPPGVSIFYEVKSDLTEDELRVMCDAGVTLVQPGVESLATSTLKLMRKGVSGPRNVAFLLACLRTGVFPTWNLLIGFPGEEEAVYEKYAADIPRLTHLPPPAGVYPVRFDRYSPYFTGAEQYGLDLAPLEYYELTYPMRGAALARTAYYFADRTRDAPYAKLAATWIDALRPLVHDWQQAWHGRGRTGPARLYLDAEGGQASIVDSRAGDEVRHPMSPAEMAVLSRLAVPQRLDRIGGQHLLPRFRELGWLFEEDQRAVSLVTRGVPPTPAFLRRRAAVP